MRQEPLHSASLWAAAPSPQAALLGPSTHCASGQVTLRRHQLPGHPTGHELAGGAGGRLNPQRLPLQTVIPVNGPINCLCVVTVAFAASMPRSIEGWSTMLLESQVLLRTPLLFRVAPFRFLSLCNGSEPGTGSSRLPQPLAGSTMGPAHKQGSLVSNCQSGTVSGPAQPLVRGTVGPFPSPSCILLLLLLSHFSRVRLCATPCMAAHQAPPSLGFSRQEHWSGLPLPSPMHESEK